MVMSRRIGGTLLATALVAVSCGGGDDDTTATDGDTATDEATADQNAGTVDIVNEPESDEGDDDAPAVSAAVDVPIARLVAHGASAPNTFGPACSTGIEESSSAMFRFTVPADWTWRGGGGGTGASDVSFDASDGGRVVVDLFKTAEELSFEAAFEIVGDAGVIIDLAGQEFPLQEVTIDGRSGYALIDVPYLGPMPIVGEHLGSVVISSNDLVLAADEIAAVLSTVRAERCSIVQEVAIWGPVGGVHLVPRFTPDPMGKTYPEQPQPTYEPGGSRTNAYSLEQVAYLLPLEISVAECVAPKAQEAAADDIVTDIQILAPTHAGKDALAALGAEC